MCTRRTCTRIFSGIGFGSGALLPEAVTLPLHPTYDHKSVGNTVPKLIRRNGASYAALQYNLKGKKSQTVRSGHIRSHMKWDRPTRLYTVAVNAPPSIRPCSGDYQSWWWWLWRLHLLWRHTGGHQTIIHLAEKEIRRLYGGGCYSVNIEQDLGSMGERFFVAADMGSTTTIADIW
ncbi:hypothetical protein AVEN_141695-1 [Araneus ventricosus]|uniref:Uncharacterized protein n=1 Tax=Araneus ventricosus TaxID=182803 RepID=A0A4Y2N7A4_ARAVE|nr:hypothetical protein AVEN_141695-1 [Araneus ventricosus]